MNHKPKIKSLLAIIALGVFFTSCISNVEELEDSSGENPNVDTKVSFKSDVEPIIDARCISCHSAGGNFPELTSHTKISANATIVKNAVASQRMPQGGTLSAAQIASIVNWVDEGALDN
ncbi:c-type cytochrome [Polaribacter sp.]|uniref:c-type cytochrome n=1 Tax=Polaribacter sp. TaxID=1920175 RepID=UPI003F6C4D8C